MNIMMETIDEQIIKPILKRTASLSEASCGFLGEMKALATRPPIPGKRVCIKEDHNNVGVTYSCWEYDRTKATPSLGTQHLINMQHSYQQAHHSYQQAQQPQQITAPIAIPESSKMDLVLTEDIFTSNQWEMIGSAETTACPYNDFHPGEWADMFLSMGNTF